MPGAAGAEPGPPETPPAVSAYTGAGDVPPPPGLWRHPRTHPPVLRRPAPPGPATDPAGHVAARRVAAAPGVLRRARRPATGHRHDRHEARATSWRSVACCPDRYRMCVPGGELVAVAGNGGTRRDAAIYHVEIANIGTLESNSPVMIDDVVVGSVGKMTLHGWHVDVDVSVKPDVVVPANAVATVGQTSLLGSMHLALDPPPGQAPSGRLQPGATIGLNGSSTYPSTEQTLSSLAAVVNGGGLGQVGDIIHNFNTALSGRQEPVRDLITRLDTFVGTLYRQRDNIIATIDELNRFSATLGGQQEVITRALNRIPPALDVLVRERPQAHHRPGEAGHVQRNGLRAGQRHPGRPGEEPAEPRADASRACRRGPRDRHRARLHPDLPADAEPHRPGCPRRLHEPLRHSRFHEFPVEAGTCSSAPGSGRTGRR